MLEKIISQVNAIVWNPALVVLLIAAGLYFSFRTRFVQVRRFGLMLRSLFSKGQDGKGISSFEAFCIALSGRVGTGNIVGVATAIAFGGPGAVFWMWVVAFFGASTAFVESTLAQSYKFSHHSGYRGGPFSFIEHGLKARWLNNLTKTGEFSADAVLAALEQGPTSNAQNVTMRHYNVATAGTCFTVGDAYGPNTTWDSFGWGAAQRLNRYYVNLLTNFKGTGVEDPRANKLIPSGMYKVTLNADGSIRNYEWLRDCGVDNQNPDDIMPANRVVSGNLNNYLNLASADVTKTYTGANILKFYNSVEDFLTAVHKYYSDDNVTVTRNGDDVTIVYHPGAMYVNDSNPLYVEDIKYINVKADALFETYGLAENDENTYYCNGAHGSRSPAGKIGFVVGTGAFYTRPTSNSYIMTYPEMCFIKAEILFNKNDKSGAYTAYINGIKAHFELMNQKLAEWQGAGYCTTAKGFDVSFAYAPIPQSQIDAYMRSAAVKQSANDLTLSDIMMQKYIAMGPDMQKYNDVRKYNYWRDGVYTEMKVPAFRNVNAAGFSSDPSKQTFYPRRWQQSTHETNYNAKNVNAIYEQYSNYVQFSTKVIALAPQVWTIPVWWDME